MKKLYAYFMAALVAVFVLVACGNNNEPNNPNNPDTPGNDSTETPGGNDSLINSNDYAQLILGMWAQDSAVIDNNGEKSYDESFSGGFTSFSADNQFEMFFDATSTTPDQTGTYTLVGPTLMMDYYQDGELVHSALYSIMHLNQTSLIIRAVYDTDVVTYHFTRVNK